MTRWRMLVVSCVYLLLGSPLIQPCAALTPPTRAEIDLYRLDGSLDKRAEMAARFGNHLMTPRGGRQASKTLGRGTDFQALASLGEQQVLALLIAFSDFPPVSSQAEVQSALFGDGASRDFPYESLRNYYLRSSYGQLEIKGDTLGWYEAPYSRDEVATTDLGREQLIMEALHYYDELGHDFSSYDNDNDGQIDYMVVVWTGPNDGWGGFWWGYFTSFSAVDDALIDGKRLGAYSWQWENREYPGPYSPRVVIHETGHALGLPDYYDYNSVSGPDGGLGNIDMMDASIGDHNCFSKYLLGWLDPVVYSAGTNEAVLAPSRSSPDTAILMPGDPVSSPFAEYFMVEYRDMDGNDLEHPGSGLLIWHVDGRVDEDGLFQYDNSYTAHKLLRLMEADGFEEIERGDGEADADDYYRPGAVFGPSTFPNSDRYDGNRSGIVVDSITSEPGEMHFASSLGSGCAIYCENSGPTPSSVTDNERAFFAAETRLESCLDEASLTWVFGDGSLVQTSDDRVSHAYEHGGAQYNWEMVATAQDAVCTTAGSIYVCTGGCDIELTKYEETLVNWFGYKAIPSVTSGSVVFVPNEQKGIHILGANDGRLLHTISPPDDGAYYSFEAVAVSDDLLVTEVKIRSAFNEHLRAYNISDVRHPSLVWDIDIGTNEDFRKLIAANSRVYALVDDWNEHPGGILVFDIATGAMLGEYRTDAIARAFEVGEDGVVLLGRYPGNHPTVEAIDMTEPSSPQLLGTWTSNHINVVTSLERVGQEVYCGVYGRLMVLDVADWENMQQVAVFDLHDRRVPFVASALFDEAIVVMGGTPGGDSSFYDGHDVDGLRLVHRIGGSAGNFPGLFEIDFLPFDDPPIAVHIVGDTLIAEELVTTGHGMFSYHPDKRRLSFFKLTYRSDHAPPRRPVRRSN